jgi:hypothetical protein
MVGSLCGEKKDGAHGVITASDAVALVKLVKFVNQMLRSSLDGSRSQLDPPHRGFMPMDDIQRGTHLPRSDTFLAASSARTTITPRISCLLAVVLFRQTTTSPSMTKAT